MKTLVIGGGGREHALIWKLAQSPKVSKIYCAPGNPGIATWAESVPLKVTALEELVKFALAEKIDLTFVGPEAPLVEGIVDQFEEAGLKIIGPRAKAAQLEGSKAFAKEIMEKYQIPTGKYQVFTEITEAKAYIEKIGSPCVIKMDGIAAGKGVVVAQDLETALNAATDFLPAENTENKKLLVEEFLEGEEITVMAFSDGEHLHPMVWAQDHKRIYDGDQGLNTGGMGAYSPTGLETPQLEEQIYQEILLPTIRGMAREGEPYRGILYAGLILTKTGPKVLEYNCRFGDPECQVVIPRLETDLIDIGQSILAGNLNQLKIKWKEEVAVCVIAASKGYPEDFSVGYPITGLDKIPNNSLVFQGGTAKKDQQLVTAGGRVLGITALGNSLQEAIENAYQGIEEIQFTDKHFRKDIGGRALKRK